MSCCQKESLLQDLKNARKNLNPPLQEKLDLNHAYELIRTQLLELYPLNKIPNSLVEYLGIFKERIELAEETFVLVIDKMIEEIEKDNEKKYYRGAF